MLRSPTKLVANIPPGVGADSSRPYPNIIKYTYSHYRIRTFTLSNTHFRLPFRGCIHICGHDESAPTAADRLPITGRTFCKTPTLTYEMGCEHSARRRGPIHRARILTLSNTHICITKYVHSHHRTHISTLSNMCIHIIEYVYSFHRIRAFALPHTHIRPPFRGCFRICGHDKSAPTAANNLPFRCERIAKTLRTDCECVANTDMRAR